MGYIFQQTAVLELLDSLSWLKLRSHISNYEREYSCHPAPWVRFPDPTSFCLIPLASWLLFGRPGALTCIGIDIHGKQADHVRLCAIHAEREGGDGWKINSNIASASLHIASRRSIDISGLSRSANCVHTSSSYGCMTLSKTPGEIHELPITLIRFTAIILLLHALLTVPNESFSKF